MWVIAIWFVTALVVSIIFGSMVRRSSSNLDREITTRVADGQHSHITK